MIPISSEFYPWKRTTNPLIQKDDVGQAKNSTVNLPGKNFVYGKPLNRDHENAKEVTMSWKFHGKTEEKAPERNFRALNKMAIKKGCFTAKEIVGFRQANDARLNIKKGSNKVEIQIPLEDFTYGVKNKPSTPMKNVMGHAYGIEAELQAAQIYENQRQFQKQQNIKAKCSTTTPKLEKLKKKEEPKQKSTFKLSRFKTQGAKINTYAKPMSTTTGKSKGLNEKNIGIFYGVDPKEEYNKNMQKFYGEDPIGGKAFEGNVAKFFG